MTPLRTTAGAVLLLAAAVGAEAQPRIAGNGPFLLLQPDGSVSLFGELHHLPPGDGSEARPGMRKLPQPVPGVAHAVDLAGSTGHALVALADGRVLAWGDSCAGAGHHVDGQPMPLLRPEPVRGADRVVQVVAGSDFSAARTADGAVLVWGKRPADDGGLIPARPWGCAPPLRLALSGVVQISAGAAHLLALSRDGTVYAGGRNEGGALGTGRQEPQLPPTRVQGLPAMSLVVALGTRSLALGRDGSVWQWGEGLGARPARLSLPGKAVGLQGHGGYAMAQTAEGALWVWGEGYGGVFADGSFDHTSERPRKVPLKFLPIAWYALNHAVFAWRADGTLFGWGAHGFTVPGSPRRGHSTVPEALLSWSAPDRWAAAR